MKFKIFYCEQKIKNNGKELTTEKQGMQLQPI